ncbi:phage tail assembly chaperone [Bacillus mobilis]|uniref:phage tail assembly chaperone n=1 Tax=Bacillus mobilis TaxID=2026190 RepID=UPI003D65A398
MDVEELYRIAVGVLNISPLDFWEITPKEIMVAAEGYYKHEREYLEMISRAVTFGYAGAKKGKVIPLFEDKKSKPKVNKIGKNEVNKKKEELDKIFGVS